jgi:hypothetical protein
MQPRDYEDGKRRLNFPRHDQPAFWLLPQTAGVPHPARPYPFQSPKRALVAALPGFRLDLRRGVLLRIPPLTPCSIAPLHSPRHKSRPKHRFSAHSGRRSPFGQLFAGKFVKGARPLAIHAL